MYVNGKSELHGLSKHEKVQIHELSEFLDPR